MHSSLSKQGEGRSQESTLCGSILQGLCLLLLLCVCVPYVCVNVWFQNKIGHSERRRAHCDECVSNGIHDLVACTYPGCNKYHFEEQECPLKQANEKDASAETLSDH